MKAAEIRAMLATLTESELAKRIWMLGLVNRIDSEILALRVLVGNDGKDEPLHLIPAPDTRLAAIILLHQQELKKRCTLKGQVTKDGNASTD